MNQPSRIATAVDDEDEGDPSQVDLDGDEVDPTVTTENKVTLRKRVETDHLYIATTVRKLHQAKNKDDMPEQKAAIKKLIKPKQTAIEDGLPKDRADAERDELVQWVLTTDIQDPDRLESRARGLY